MLTALSFLTPVLILALSRLFQTQPDFTDLVQVLAWLTGIGAVFVAGKVVAFLAENFQFWHGLDPRVKFVIPIVLSVLIGLGADTLLQLPDVIAVLSPAFTKVMLIVLLYFGTQTGYMQAKASNYGSAARALHDGRADQPVGRG
jgi:hypothetical protein